MKYAAHLLDAVKTGKGLMTDSAIANALGVNKTAISQWPNAIGYPMKLDHVMQLSPACSVLWRVARFTAY